MSLSPLVEEIRACRICSDALPLGPRPVVQVDESARVLIVGQAPGRRVHESGVPFDDASGDRLRSWLGVSREVFYDPRLVAIVPMGFCFPGTGPSGDLPPRPECAPQWRTTLLNELVSVRLTLVIGQYALRWHLPDAGSSVTEAGPRLARTLASPRPNATPEPTQQQVAHSEPLVRRGTATGAEDPSERPTRRTSLRPQG